MEEISGRARPLHPLKVNTAQWLYNPQLSDASASRSLLESPESCGLKTAPLLQPKDHTSTTAEKVGREKGRMRDAEEEHHTNQTSPDASVHRQHGSSTDSTNTAVEASFSLDRLQELEAENKRLRDECRNCQRMLKDIRNENAGRTQAVEEERNDLLAGFQREYASKDAKVRELEGLLVSLRNDTAFAAALRKTKTELESKVGTLASILGDVPTVRTPVSRPDSMNFGRPQRTDSWRNSATVRRRSMRRFDSGSSSLRPLQLVTAKSSQSAPTSARSPLNSAQNEALLALEGRTQTQPAADSTLGDSRPSTSSSNMSHAAPTRSSFGLSTARLVGSFILEDTKNACLPPFIQAQSQSTAALCTCPHCKEPSSRQTVRQWMRRWGVLDYLESFLETSSVTTGRIRQGTQLPTDIREHGDSGYVSPELIPTKVAKGYG